MIEIDPEIEDAIRRNLANESVDSSPDKPSPDKSKLSDEAAAEHLQWQEWQDWHEEGTEEDQEQGMFGGEIEKHPDQDSDDSICWDHSLFNKIDLVDV